MATVIDELLVNLGFDADPAGANKFSANLNNVIGTIGKVGTVMTAVTAAAAGFLGKGFLATASQFEQFGLQLETLEGSSAKAEESLKWIKEFGKTTPYGIEETTQAFIKLRAYGIDATDGIMTSLGDAAGALGGNLIENIEALSDAQMGENQRLINAFNIKAKDDGDEWTYTYQNLKTMQQESVNVLKSDAAAIKETIAGILDNNYGGGMEKLAGSWEGVLGNMDDVWIDFKDKVMDRGLFAKLKEIIISFSNYLDKNADKIADIAERIGDDLVGVFMKLRELLFDLWDGALWARDGFKSLNKQFDITGKGAAILGGFLALLAANIAGLMAAKMIAGITSLARGLMLLFSPLALIGVGLLAVFLIAEDIYGFLNGKDSIVGSLIKDYPIINDVIALIMKVVDAISAIWTDNEESLGQLFNAVGELIMAFEPLVDLVLEILPEAFAFFLEVAVWVIGVITDAVGIFAKIFTGLILFLKVLWQSLFWSLRTVFEGFFDIVTNKIKGVMTLIGGMAKSLAAIFNGDVIEGIKIGAKAVWEGGGQILSKHSDDYIAKKDGSASVSNSGKSATWSGKNAIDYSKAYTQNSNQSQSTVTQHINVASANEAAIVARNGAAQGTRQINYGYQ